MGWSGCSGKARSEAAGLPAPEYEETANSVKLILRNNIDVRAAHRKNNCTGDGSQLHGGQFSVLVLAVTGPGGSAADIYGEEYAFACEEGEAVVIYADRKHGNGAGRRRQGT